METSDSLVFQEEEWMKNVYQGDRMPEFTLQVIIVGVLLGTLLIASNIYLGLKTGFTQGGSIISAILAFAIIKSLRGNLSVLENNIAQTTASGAASIGIMVSVIPALILLDYQFTGIQLFIWIFLVSILGILFAVSLRKQLVVIERLTFPSGTACAATIKAMHAHGAETIQRATALVLTGILSGAITWFRDAVPKIIPGIMFFPGKISGYALGQLNLGINWSPMLFGAGFLIGLRTGVSLLLGAILGWGILAPYLASHHIIAGTEYRQIANWTMWVAIALMITSGVISLVLRKGTIIRALRSMMNARLTKEHKIEFPFYFWLIGILITSILCAVTMTLIFSTPIWMSLFAIVISYLFAIVVIRAYGETDINPVGAVGHSTQIIFGVVAPGKIITNLMTAGITAEAANQSADMMQDLKTGYLLGATPWKQTFAQLIGATIGSLVAVPIFLIVTGAYGIGTESMPAPSAISWSGMAKLLSEGLSALPPYTLTGVLTAVFLGTLLAFMENTRFKRFIPSPYGLGIGVIVPGFFSISMFLGAITKSLIGKKFPTWTEHYATSVGSGGIVGEAIMGVLISILKISGVF